MRPRAMPARMMRSRAIPAKMMPVLIIWMILAVVLLVMVLGGFVDGPGAGPVATMRSQRASHPHGSRPRRGRPPLPRTGSWTRPPPPREAVSSLAGAMPCGMRRFQSRS